MTAASEMIASAEADIAQRRQITGRSCGSCSLCCRLLKIDDPELQKPENQWCQHVLKPNGCGIYATRPGVCRAFACRWLIDPTLDDRWFPQACGIVIHMPSIDGRLDGPAQLEFNVDPRTPQRWREQPYFGAIRHTARKLLREFLAGQRPEMIRTIVKVRNKQWLVLPNIIVEDPQWAVTLPTADPDVWRFIRFRDQAAFERANAAIAAGRQLIERGDAVASEVDAALVRVGEALLEGLAEVRQ